MARISRIGIMGRPFVQEVKAPPRQRGGAKPGRLFQIFGLVIARVDHDGLIV